MKKSREMAFFLAGTGKKPFLLPNFGGGAYSGITPREKKQGGGTENKRGPFLSHNFGGFQKVPLPRRKNYQGDI